MGTKRVIWVTNSSDLAHTKESLLKALGFETTYVLDSQQLNTELLKKRANIIIISDRKEQNTLVAQLLEIVEFQEARGARLILAAEILDPNVTNIAASCNFRDIIPMDLPDQEWTQRLYFSTMGKEVEYPSPSGQIALNNISKIYAPARLICISDSYLRLETSMLLEAGQFLLLHGTLPKLFDLDSINIRIENPINERLYHRFSYSYNAKWALPSQIEKKDKLQSIFQQLKMNEPQPRWRVFFATKSSKLREQLLRCFPNQEFKVSSALNIKNMLHEPVYFTPDLMIIDFSLCGKELYSKLRELVLRLKKETPIIIIDEEGKAKFFKDEFPSNKIFIVETQLQDLTVEFFKAYLPQISKIRRPLPEDTVFFDATDTLSFAHLGVSARLRSIHPHTVELALPIDFRQYSLIRLSSPLVSKEVGREVWLKITKCEEDQSIHDSFKFMAETFIVDLSWVERRKLGKALGRLISDHFSKDESISHKTLKEHIQTASQFGITHKKFKKLWMLKNLIYQNYHRIVRSTHIRYLVIFLIVTLLSLALLIEVLPIVAEYYSKSGKIYGDQLMKFSKPSE